MLIQNLRGIFRIFLNLIFRRRRNSSIIIPNWGGLRLKAILASEWSQLKKKYKEIQKQNMRKLKQSLKVTLDSTPPSDESSTVLS